LRGLNKSNYESAGKQQKSREFPRVKESGRADNFSPLSRWGEKAVTSVGVNGKSAEAGFTGKAKKAKKRGIDLVLPRRGGGEGLKKTKDRGLRSNRQKLSTLGKCR